MTDARDMDAATSADLMFRNARREERKETNWIAKIRLFDGREIATSVKDISASGARLSVPEGMELPERFMFRVIGRDFVCAVKVAWRRGSHVGVRIERVGKLETKPAALPVAALPEEEKAGPGSSDLMGRRGSRISSC
ncbi:PilZ domain-containing protein [Methylobacterium sp. J-076]|uniref:PilZ domain-containing protein n=1 Tax=Methylobacterium sp. J-076 TaxID=2836655 RepID=UPI001FBA657D|nr:PilZ domain-containing protein [Methylobacterium sp. J-076]MCJ2012704.1 PilZ domain-containing protein [Methylobacterium sp. J-076]